MSITNLIRQSCDLWYGSSHFGIFKIRSPSYSDSDSGDIVKLKIYYKISSIDVTTSVLLDKIVRSFKVNQKLISAPSCDFKNETITNRHPNCFQFSGSYRSLHCRPRHEPNRQVNFRQIYRSIQPGIASTQTRLWPQKTNRLMHQQLVQLVISRALVA